MKKIKLSNGVEMPQLGYGVYQVEPDECERCVLDALSVGYRMIDSTGLSQRGSRGQCMEEERRQP